MRSGGGREALKSPQPWPTKGGASTILRAINVPFWKTATNEASEMKPLVMSTRNDPGVGGATNGASKTTQSTRNVPLSGNRSKRSIKDDNEYLKRSAFGKP